MDTIPRSCSEKELFTSRHTRYKCVSFLDRASLSFDAVNGTVVQIASDAGNYEVEHGFFSNFSAVLTCISNVGPAFEAAGPYSSFAGYSGFSKKF